MTENHKFFDFMNGFTAAAQLANRAAENGYTIEFIILAASVIDGALRIGLNWHSNCGHQEKRDKINQLLEVTHDKREKDVYPRV